MIDVLISICIVYFIESEDYGTYVVSYPNPLKINGYSD